jgi:flagellar basal-body rod protein FlgG
MPTNGIYSAAAGMAAQQSRLDAVANDLANTNTTGYKSERVGFRDLLDGAGSKVVDLGRTLVQGVLQPSDDPLSVAIDGPGFLQVRRADGTTALTRNGQLQLDARGSLVTGTGEQLVPPITFPAGTQPGDVTIAGDGTVSAAGRTVGQIRLLDVPAPEGLQSVGSSMFVPTQSSGAAVPAAAARLQQHQLEASNVDMAASMTELMDAQQSYQLASRAIQTQDQLLNIANQLKK